MTQAARYNQRLTAILDAQGSHPDLVMALIAIGDAHVRVYEEHGDFFAAFTFADRSEVVIALTN